jgi:hypothetical protein
MNVTDLTVVALIAGLTGWCGLLLYALVARRRLASMRERLQEQADITANLEGSLGALLSCSRQIGDRISDVERRDRTLQKQLDHLAFNRDEGQVAVEHAMKLLASGQDIGPVTKICELSSGEVEILQNLSRFRPAA